MDKKKIMIVDDEQDFLTIVKLNLQQTGKFEVLTLSSAKDIIENVHNFRPDVILIDILMPKIGGLDVCKKLNEDPMGINIPIIVLSALERNEDKLKAFKAGVVDYLVKPIDKNDLVAKIEKVLRYK
jgi:two-component system alkaline phosphatase synthesis response regulator PhoP